MQYLFIYLCIGVSVSTVNRFLNSTWVDLKKVCNPKIQWPTIPVWWQKKRYCSICLTLCLQLMEFMIITVYKLSFHINQWKELVCWKPRFFVGVHWIEFADTTLGISEQYLFSPFALKLNFLTSISSILLNQPPMDKWWIKSLCM